MVRSYRVTKSPVALPTAVLLCFIGISGNALSAPRAVEEYALKAALVLNFARFTEWPRSTFKGPDEPLNFCVLGDNVSKEDFDGIEGKTVGSRPVRVNVAKMLELDQSCHVVFITGVERTRLPRIMAALNGSPTLTIGEMTGFNDAGGMINFININGRLKFGVNLSNITKSELKLSSRLLKLAHAVEGSQEKR